MADAATHTEAWLDPLEVSASSQSSDPEPAVAFCSVWYPCQGLVRIHQLPAQIKISRVLLSGACIC